MGKLKSTNKISLMLELKLGAFPYLCLIKRAQSQSCMASTFGSILRKYDSEMQYDWVLP